jgi:ubiquinone biosynthesis protein
MAIPLNPKHLKKYARLAALLVKYGRSDLVKQAGLDPVLADAEPLDPLDSPLAEELTNDLEAMGPTFIKLGQLLSSRVDLLPKPYTDALSRLHDRVEPFPFEEAREIIERELGVKVSRAFESIEEKPIAAASLGQVHRATLRSGRTVAVKVQRPGVREQVVDDFEALSELTEFLDAHTEVGRRYRFTPMLEEGRRTLLGELDYQREAANLETLARNLASYEHIVVPCPVADYTTSRVLTMEYVQGRNISELSPLARMELDGGALAEELFKAYLQQVLVDGFFHADPHPGNVFLTDDGRVALLDVGMVGRLPVELQDGMLRMLLAMAEGRGRDAADLAIEMGDRTDQFDRDGFRDEIGRLVLEYVTGSSGEMQMGVVVMELTRAAGNHGLIIPAQLTMLGKTLLNLDQVGRTLDPAFQPNAAIQRNATDLLRQRMLKNASPSHIVTSLLETNQFVQRLPGRLNRVFDAVEQREFEVRVRLANDSLLLDGLQKIANRIATGAVLAALIVAAAMLMQIDSSYRLMGYPALAIVLFLAAAVGACLLLVDVARHDREARKLASRKES